MKKTVQVEVIASVDDVLVALTKGITDIKAAVKSGGPAEIPMIVSALVADLLPILSQVASLPEDVKADVATAMETVAVRAPQLVKAILG